MSSRAVKALAVLADGGQFVERLERNYRGHMKFVTRLQDAAGAVVKGIGGQTCRELSACAGGVLVSSEIHSTGTGRTWRLADARRMPAEMAVRFDAALEAR